MFLLVFLDFFLESVIQSNDVTVSETVTVTYSDINFEQIFLFCILCVCVVDPFNIQPNLQQFQRLMMCTGE